MLVAAVVRPEPRRLANIICSEQILSRRCDVRRQTRGVIESLLSPIFIHEAMSKTSRMVRVKPHDRLKLRVVNPDRLCL